jgi:hypothetical protein
MQKPTTEDVEPPIPTETVSSDSNMDRTVAVRRRAAHRTPPWDLAAGELDLVPPQPPQAEEIPTRKKRRIEEPFSASTAPTDEATSKSASPDVSVDLPPPAADNDDVNADPMPDTQPNAGVTGAIGRWTPEEDAKLTSALANTSKKSWGFIGEAIIGKTDWVAVAALIPGRTKSQCYNRSRNVLCASIVQANERKGKWTEDEDIKLKDAIQTHGDKNWKEISALVPGRKNDQCRQRWNKVSSPTNERTGTWIEDEDVKLKDSVRLHDGKDWAAIAALVPGRTKQQCWGRWKNVLDPSIDRAKWAENEVSKLKDAIQMHGDNCWDAIATLVPGRTRNQCRDKWHYGLNPSIARMEGRAGTWAEDEDIQLKDAIQTHGDRNWNKITACFPGRTKDQCRQRWRKILSHTIDRENGRTGKWTPDEDGKLRDSVRLHGGKNWTAISTVVPGRTRNQCWKRWKDVMDHSIDRPSGSTGNG